MPIGLVALWKHSAQNISQLFALIIESGKKKMVTAYFLISGALFIQSAPHNVAPILFGFVMSDLTKHGKTRALIARELVKGTYGVSMKF